MRIICSRFSIVLDPAEYLAALAQLTVLDWAAGPRPETSPACAIREEGERLRSAFSN